MPQKEFNLKDPEIINVALLLGLDEDMIETTNIRKRLKALFDFWQKKNPEVGLLAFARDLLSKLGHKGGVHPLDVLYSYILTQKLLKEPSPEESLTKVQTGSEKSVLKKILSK